MEQKDIIDLILQNLREIISAIGVIVGWILKHEIIRKSNKKIGKWKLESRKVYTFYELITKIYAYFFFMFLFSQFIKIIIRLFYNNMFFCWSYTIIQILINLLITIRLSNKSKAKEVMKKNRKMNIFLIIYFNVLFDYIYIMDQFDNFLIISSIIFIFFFFLWMDLMFKNSEIIYILPHEYADIYFKSGVIIKALHTRSIHKKEDWIIANSLVDYRLEEYHIKENEIINVKYYGEPIEIRQKLEWLIKFDYSFSKIIMRVKKKIIKK